MSPYRVAGASNAGRATGSNRVRAFVSAGALGGLSVVFAAVQQPENRGYAFAVLESPQHCGPVKVALQISSVEAGVTQDFRRQAKIWPSWSSRSGTRVNQACVPRCSRMRRPAWVSTFR